MRYLAVCLLFAFALNPGCSCQADAPAVDGGLDGFDRDAALASADALFGAACAGASAKAGRVPAYLLFVLDGSGSMDLENKWVAVTAALDAIFDELLASADPSLGVGLTIFADQNDPTIDHTTAGPYDKMDVPIAFVDAAQHGKLRARVDGTTPNLGTPTYEVLSGQFPLLEQFMAQPPLLPDGRPVLVFMSDGVPDPDMPAGANEGPWSLALVDAMAKLGIPTYAVGIGNINPHDPEVYDPTFMGQLAHNGGVAPAACNPVEATDPARMCHFQITPGGKSAAQLTQEFIDAIHVIQQRALPCEYVLEPINGGGPVDPTLVNVVYTDGNGLQVVIGQSPTSGWTYDDPVKPTKVMLNGAICDKVKSDPHGSITIVLGCSTIIL